MSKAHLIWTEAFRAELDVVNKRRSVDKQVKDDLVGLAFSGGGIRSATFGLGVLEALKELRLLEKIDYLSTVSGGGYIGAWLSANCKRAADQDPPADWLGEGADWTDSIDYLRRYSNYLSPMVGFFSADTWSMATIWLRNTTLVQLTVILAIALALLVPRLLFEGFRYWRPCVGNWRWTTICLFIFGAVGIAANQWRLNHSKVAFGSWLKGLAAAVICGAIALFVGIHFDFQPFGAAAIDYRVAGPIAVLLVLTGFWMQPAVAKLFVRGGRQVNYGQGGVQFGVVLPMLAVGFLVAAIMWWQGQAEPFARMADFGDFFLNAWRYWEFPLTVVFTSLLLFSFCSMRSLRGWKKLAAVVAPIPAMIVLHLLLSAIMWVFHGPATTPHDPKATWLAYVWGPPMVLYSFALTIVILLGMLGRQSTEGKREWWSRFGAWLAIYGTAWMVINVAAAYAPLWGGIVLSPDRWKGFSLTWAGTTLAGLFAGASGSTGGKSTPSFGAKVLGWVAEIAPYFFVAGLLLVVSYVIHLIVTLNSTTPDIHANDPWTLLNAASFQVTVWVFVICLAAFLLLAWRVDINEFGLNAFYRSRLVRCYLGATRFRENERNPQRFTGFDENDDLWLAALAQNPAGPLHIVNCALDLGGSSDLALHTRHSAIFTLTPLHCGSRYMSRDADGKKVLEMGYTPTAIFGGQEGQPTLGQAISVSGAAASPNMGYHTSPVVAFLLTLFDVRLGWWFPNPRKSGVQRASPLFSLRYLLMEVFGAADDKSKYLAISDGGHFENLAGYELVKRKCRVILISDAECDPKLGFEGLGTLIRVCEVDFGTTITIDVRPIQPAGESLWSQRRCAVGTIDYHDGSPLGTLIYFKASMTGKEDTSILQYKAAHPTFPHESTSDQFYKEDQFESYRRLGNEIASHTFESVRAETDFVTLAGKISDG